MRVAGFGLRAATGVASLTDALAAALAQTAAGEEALTALAAPADKAGAPALQALAAELGLPIHAIPPARLAAVTTVTESPRVRAVRDTGSVAEAAALAAVGPGARLLSPRQIAADRMATCAIATGEPNK